MRKKILLLIGIFVSIFCFGQTSPYPVYKNLLNPQYTLRYDTIEDKLLITDPVSIFAKYVNGYKVCGKVYHSPYVYSLDSIFYLDSFKKRFSNQTII